MKKIFFIFALLFTSSSAYSKEENKGIQFFKGTWNELLAEAKRQNKPIFVDVYTTWCRPCKVLDKDVFRTRKLENFTTKILLIIK